MFDISIRLSDDQEQFVYSIRRDGVVIETAAVPVVGVAEPDACAYYGGSEVMD